MNVKNIKNEKLRNLIHAWQQEDGVYLVNNTIIGGAYYLFLNVSIIEDGDKPTYFPVLSVGFESNAMHIYYVEKELGYKNNRDKILYRIPIESTPDTVKIYKNGEEVYFNSLGVIVEK